MILSKHEGLAKLAEAINALLPRPRPPLILRGYRPTPCPKEHVATAAVPPKIHANICPGHTTHREARKF
jgi:hypothetical protein